MAAVRPDGVSATLLRALPIALLAGLVGLLVPLVLHVSDGHRHDDQRDAVLTAARSEVTNLMNISYATVARDLDRIIAGATGDLRANYQTLRKKAQALSQTKSEVTGSVVSAGLLWVDESKQTARTVIAAEGTDTAAGSVVLHYRWVLTLRHEHGRWLTVDAALEGQPS
jgi:Mce-associated membrane protein